LALIALFAFLAACGDEEPRAEESPSPAALACGSGDIRGDVISRVQVEVLEQDQAKATYVLTRDAEVGILVSRQEGDRLQLVGRVPFGPQRSTVVNEETFDLPKPEHQPLEPGEYEFTLRAFDAGKLNQGDPVDTRSACVTIE
jgi:hypothetical protein